MQQKMKTQWLPLIILRNLPFTLLHDSLLNPLNKSPNWMQTTHNSLQYNGYKTLNEKAT